MAGAEDHERFGVMVVLVEQLDGEAIVRNLKDKATRRSHTLSALKELSNRTEAELLAELEGHRRAAAGVYFYRLETSLGELSQKAVMTR
ncbi:MAG TPA: hypothetical protein ENN51_04865 [candidate division WOR-3 bacterium]|uniref:Uncharacterized protein n=1 Tax=candidate division WOR-3 bacterium TaxID=2052148 RepID=A0A7V0T5L3_UNCW3|nr:hypothetical protein [candidate division WOR-3 bacterium]